MAVLAAASPGGAVCILDHFPNKTFTLFTQLHFIVVGYVASESIWCSPLENTVALPRLLEGLITAPTWRSPEGAVFAGCST